MLPIVLSLVIYATLALAYTEFASTRSPVRGLSGWYAHRSHGSNARRVVGRLAYVLGGFVLLDGLLNTSPSPILAALAVIYALGLFVVKIVVVLVILPNKSFAPSIPRLLGDVLLSSLFSVAAFGYLFQVVGIQYTLDTGHAVRTLDHYYFAAVTFSTLGYGDFAPDSTGWARTTAAFLALYGNIHLGVMAGSLMALLRR